MRIPHYGRRHFAPLLTLAFLLLSCTTTGERQRLAESYTELGVIYSSQNQWDKAGQAWNRALELDPKQNVAAYNLVRAFTETGLYDKALEQADRILRYDPDNSLAKTAKAYALYRSGRNAEALELYRQVVALYGDDDLNSSYNLAILLEAAGETAAALELYGSLRQRVPDNVDVQYRYGVLLLAAGQTDEAIAELEAYRAARASSLPVLKALVAAYTTAARYDKLVEALQALAGRVPTEPVWRFELARVRLTAMEETEDGISDLEQALRAGYNDQAAIDALLAFPDLKGRDRIEQAINAVREAAAVSPESGVAPATAEAGTGL